MNSYNRIDCVVSGLSNADGIGFFFTKSLKHNTLKKNEGGHYNAA
jgi:hypothetical protein